MKKTLSHWLPVFLWAVVIFAFSTIPQIVVSQFFIWDFIAKKTAHISEYAILFALIFRATNRSWILSFFSRRFRRLRLASFLSGILLPKKLPTFQNTQFFFP